jgi:hypothetical protein
MKQSLLNEMKSNSGLHLKESDISQEKQMNAESRMVGAFARLISELKHMKIECERVPYHYNSDRVTPTEVDEQRKTIDKEKLFDIAMEKLEIIKDEIKKTFDKDVKIVVVKKVEKSDDDDDDDENEHEY